MRRALLLLLVVVGVQLAMPSATAADPTCLVTDYTPAAPGPVRLRFGDDPELAGDAGPTQLPAVPLDDKEVSKAVLALQVPGTPLVQRLNRLFESDGDAGIERFRRMVARWSALGLASEVQVRYHPTAQQEGDLAAWVRYVRRVVDRIGADRHVVSMTITNEVNLPISPNTSDGGYKRATDALMQGILAAHDEARRRGFDQLRFGFTYAYRSPQDNSFWQALSAGGPRFRAALDFVGLDLYPGTVFPPVVVPPGSEGDATVQALGVLRRCLMPMGGIGSSTAIWLTENGYASAPLPKSEAGQVAALTATVRALCRYGGGFGVTDYRYFNLRDNNSLGAGLFSADGLLRDDDSRKPAYAAFRGLVRECGVVAKTVVVRPVPTPRVAPARHPALAATGGASPWWSVLLLAVACLSRSGARAGREPASRPSVR
ncbi:MAG: hypothetical protein JWN31_355 [Frankiales bacterium]|nr:hypothetical protein [Frankiales bacterium]